MVPVFASAAVAILLVGGGRAGSLLPECPWDQGIQGVPFRSRNVIVFEPYNQEEESQAKTPDLRQGKAVLVRELQGLVRTKGHSALLWRRRKEGKHCSYRAIHRKPEERVYGCDSGANPGGGIPP